MNTVRWMLICLIGFCLFGCGGGGGGGGGSTVQVNVTPATQGVLINGTQQYTAAIANTPNATFGWTVQEGAAGGTISANGLYHAPATAGTYHVVATGGGGTGSATVIVHPIVSVTPASPTVLAGAGHSQTFIATVAGTSNQGVSWQVEETGGGTISVGGVYSPPVTPGLYHVIATSAADMAASGTAAVTVEGGNISGTIQ